MDNQLEKLDLYIASLTQEQRAIHEEKINNPQAIFKLIKQGDTVGVTVAIQNGIDLNVKNDQGMNPLHVASAHDTQLIADVIIREASNAPFQRDNHDRLPLDVAREICNHKIGNKLEQVTYPELFKDEKSKQSIMMVNTAPSYLNQSKNYGRER